MEWDALESCSDKEKQSYIEEKLIDHLTNGDEQKNVQVFFWQQFIKTFNDVSTVEHLIQFLNLYNLPHIDHPYSG